MQSTPLIVSLAPRDLETPEEWDVFITEQLERLLASGLSQNERDLLAVCLRGESTVELPASVWVALDDLIIRQTGTLGWRIFLSTLVHARFRMWDIRPGGDELFERFGQALAAYGRYMHRQDKPPLSVDIKPAKKETVVELRLLLKKLEQQFAGSNRGPSTEELVAAFGALALEQQGFVASNLESWSAFLRSEAPPLLNPGTSAASLFDAWLAWATGYDQETLRQKISKLAFPAPR